MPLAEAGGRDSALRCPRRRAQRQATEPTPTVSARRFRPFRAGTAQRAVPTTVPFLSGNWYKNVRAGHSLPSPRPVHEPGPLPAPLRGARIRWANSGDVAPFWFCTPRVRPGQTWSNLVKPLFPGTNPTPVSWKAGNEPDRGIRSAHWNHAKSRTGFLGSTFRRPIRPPGSPNS